MKKVVIITFCVVLALIVCVSGHEHEHGHGHSHDDHHGHDHGHDHHHHDHEHHEHGHGHDHHAHHHEHHAHEHHDGLHHDDIEEGSVFNRYSREMNEPVPKAASPKTPKTKMPLPPKPSRSTIVIWMEALGSTILISAAPFFILFFIPLTGNTAEQKPLLKILLAFASGGLLGDAFLHLIPHAINPHSHLEDHSHSQDSHDHGHGHSHSSDMTVGFWVLGGIITFLIVEKFVRYVKGGHGHSHGPQPPSTKTTDNEVVKKDDESVRKRKKTEEDTSKEDDNTKENEETEIHEEEPKEIKVAGYLNLAADFTHNFTDGLAIGASFLVSRSLGIVTTLTILLHEVPHEIGDFAILVQSGCDKRKAMFLQLSTATGAIAGTVCGLLAHNIGSSATLWILPFTAGGFIYIATVSVIPELLGDSKIGQSIKEVIGLLFGVFMMVIIAQIE